MLTQTNIKDYYLNAVETSIIFFIFLVLVSVNVTAKINQSKKILFIGNSLTYYHDMPQTVQKMMDEQRLNTRIDQSTFPGFTLSMHATCIVNNGIARKCEHDEIPNSIDKILSNNWDVVILQEQGRTALISESNIYCFEPSFHFLDSLIKSRKGKTVLFQDYPDNSYPQQYCIASEDIHAYSYLPYKNTDRLSIVSVDRFCSNNFKNSYEEFAEIKREYAKVTRINHNGLVKVGYAFEVFKERYPGISLCESNTDSHPSRQGSYLIACLFFKYLSGKNLQHVKYSADLNPKEAQLIRKFADTIH